MQTRLQPILFYLGFSSNALIYGSGILGLTYLVLSYLNRRAKVPR